MTTIRDIADKLLSSRSVLLFCHTRPDGDTLGGAFALKKSLEVLGKTADVICDGVVPSKFSFLGFSGEMKTLGDIDKEYELHFAVDCSTEGMLGETYLLFKKNAETVSVDHHVSNTRFATLNFVADRASCCEIIFELITELKVQISEDIANCLFLGVSTDTGHFMHSNVTKETFEIASKLLSFGANSHEIGVKMFKSQSKARALLQAEVMRRMKFFEDDKIALIYINKEDLDLFGATSDFTEGFIDYPLSVDGVEVAVSILESKKNCYKISLRSKGRVNVNEIASTFGGGGHILASGCMLFGFFEDVKDKIVRAVSIAL